MGLLDIINVKEALSDKQALAVELALSGMSDTEIAKKVGVGRQRVGIWRREHTGFQAALEEGRQALSIQCREQLVNLTAEALGTVSKAMKSDNEGIRLRAALAVLRLSGIQGAAKPPKPATEAELIQIALGQVAREMGFDNPSG